MQTPEIVQALTQLNKQAQQLMADELSNAPGQAARGQSATGLMTQLQTLRSSVDQAPSADQARLDDLWREVQRALIFVTAVAGNAGGAGTSQSEAERLNAEAFTLGQQAAVPNSDKAAIRSSALALRERIIAALANPAGQETQANRLLSDAMLDALFAMQGGAGPSSLRLGQHLSKPGGK